MLGLSRKPGEKVFPDNGITVISAEPAFDDPNQFRIPQATFSYQEDEPAGCHELSQLDFVCDWQSA